jgi:hypothetical protein
MNLLELATQIANEKYGGHFTLMKFSTNYRFCFGTVEYDCDVMAYRNNIKNMREGETLDRAITRAIMAETRKCR